MHTRFCKMQEIWQEKKQMPNSRSQASTRTWRQQRFCWSNNENQRNSTDKWVTWVTPAKAEQFASSQVCQWFLNAWAVAWVRFSRLSLAFPTPERRNDKGHQGTMLKKKQIHNAPAVCSKFAGCCQILPVQRHRHSYTMTQIAPISSPWTTRSVPSIRFSQHLLWGPLPFAAPCGDTILLFPLNQFILAMKLPLLLVLGRYFVYDSEVQLLCLVDSQVHLWEQVTRPASTADWLDRLHRINIYQHLSTSINIYHIFLNILTYSKIF